MGGIGAEVTTSGGEQKGMSRWYFSPNRINAGDETIGIGKWGFTYQP